eukprot:Hpha_TRINITY_DN15035_c4_g14::TRINITY_DN15035_c4_g14_i2::g.123165::m.123165
MRGKRRLWRVIRRKNNPVNLTGIVRSLQPEPSAASESEDSFNALDVYSPEDSTDEEADADQECKDAHFWVPREAKRVEKGTEAHASGDGMTVGESVRNLLTGDRGRFKRDELWQIRLPKKPPVINFLDFARRLPPKPKKEEEKVGTITTVVARDDGTFETGDAGRSRLPHFGGMIWTVVAALRFRKKLDGLTAWERVVAQERTEQHNARIMAEEAKKSARRSGNMRLVSPRRDRDDDATAPAPILPPTSKTIASALAHGITGSMERRRAHEFKREREIRKPPCPSTGIPSPSCSPSRARSTEDSESVDWSVRPLRLRLKLRSARADAITRGLAPPSSARSVASQPGAPVRQWQGASRRAVSASASTLAVNLRRRLDNYISTQWCGTTVAITDVPRDASPRTKQYPGAEEALESVVTAQDGEIMIPHSPEQLSPECLVAPATEADQSEDNRLRPSSISVQELKGMWHLGGHAFGDRPLLREAEHQLGTYRKARDGPAVPPKVELRRVNRSHRRSKSKKVDPNSGRRSCKDSYDHFKIHLGTRDTSFHTSVDKEIERVASNSVAMMPTRREVYLQAPPSQAPAVNRRQANVAVAHRLHAEARAVNENQTATWFRDFSDRILALSRAPDTIEVLRLVGELFATDRLSAKHFEQLVDSLGHEVLFSDNVQFVLQHAAIAFGVPVSRFKEMLRRRYIHYRLHQRDQWGEGTLKGSPSADRISALCAAVSSAAAPEAPQLQVSGPAGQKGMVRKSIERTQVSRARQRGASVLSMSPTPPSGQPPSTRRPPAGSIAPVPRSPTRSPTHPQKASAFGPVGHTPKTPALGTAEPKTPASTQQPALLAAQPDWA